MPNWDGRSPGYEVWFLTMTDPSSGKGYWIRSTLLAPTTGEPSGGVWFAQFDPSDPSKTFGMHARYRLGAGAVTPEAFEVRIGKSLMRSGHAEGSIEEGGRAASWDISYATGQPTYQLLPAALYRGSIAPTKPYSPNPATIVEGTISVDGEATEIRAAPAQQGHLYGTRHAERWAWAQCGDFLDEEATLHALTARGRRGPFTLPYITFVGVRWQDRWIRLSKVSRRREFGLGTWRIHMQNRRYRLTGRIEAPARALLRARYEDPDGTPRFCHNSEIASSRLALFERRAGGFEEVALLESTGTTHAEWAGRTPAAVVENEFAEAHR